MTHVYDVELTDLYCGQANYSWVCRARVTMPELPHFGYDGTNYVSANRAYDRELMRRAKKAVGIRGTSGRVERYGDTIEFRPYGWAAVMFVSWRDLGDAG